MYVDALITDSDPGRMVLCPETIGIHGVRLLGRVVFTRAHPPLPPHTHEASTEVCLLARGRQTYTVGGRDYPLRGGDAFLTTPGEWHGTGGTPQEPCILYWMQLDTGVSGLLGLPEEDSHRLSEHFGAVRTRRFRIPRRIFELCEEAIGAAVLTREEGYDRAFAVLRCRVLLAEALLLVAEAEQRSQDSFGVPKPVQAALRRMEVNLDEPVPLAELAAASGLSLPRFKAVFKQATGMPPGEYRTRMRIEQACRRLSEDGADLTALAYELGFSSSQHFSTVFRKFKGEAPGSYRRRSSRSDLHPNT